MKYIKQAEKDFASYLGVKHTLLTSMGRTALVLGLKALGVSSGDDVIIPGFACNVVAKSVELCDARPIFADVDPRTFNIRSQEIEERLTQKTKAVVVIHCYGQPADMKEILEIAERNGICVIEDVAHSLGAEYHGRKVGTFGDISIFSFSKNMNCSSGGALSTNSDDLMCKAREVLESFSFHKGVTQQLRHSIEHRFLGFGKRQKPLLFSLKLMNLQRLGLLTKFADNLLVDIPKVFHASEQIAREVMRGLRTIDGKNRDRRERARALTQLIREIKLDYAKAPFEEKDRTHVYYIYAIKTTERGKMLKRLSALPKNVYWSLPWQCPYSYEAKKLSERLVLFEMTPYLSEENLRFIVSTLVSESP